MNHTKLFPRKQKHTHTLTDFSVLGADRFLKWSLMTPPRPRPTPGVHIPFNPRLSPSGWVTQSDLLLMDGVRQMWVERPMTSPLAGTLSGPSCLFALMKPAARWWVGPWRGPQGKGLQAECCPQPHMPGAALLQSSPKTAQSFGLQLDCHLAGDWKWASR